MPDMGAGYQMNPQRAQAAALQQGGMNQGGGKVSAEDAKYQDVAGTCASCSHFQGDQQPCDVVIEPVSAGGWCSLYAQGENQAANAGAGGGDTGMYQPSASATPAGT